MSNQGVQILDNGGSTCKVGWSSDASPRTLANYGVRPKRDNKIYICDEVDEVADTSGMFYRYPIEKGVVQNWELQGQIWKRILNQYETTPRDTNLMQLEAPFMLGESFCHEVVFETIGFQSLSRCISSVHAQHGYRAQHPTLASTLPCSLVIDCGHSVSHIIPVYNTRPIKDAIIRVSVGGKAITGLLKHAISNRQFDLSSETQIVNDIKHNLCYVSTDFDQDLYIAGLTTPGMNTLRREFILPDFLTTFKGHAREPAVASILQDPLPDGVSAVTLTNERFGPCEALFRPIDIGQKQAGLGEAVIQALQKCPPELAAPMLSNIICVGGCFKFPQMVERLQAEIRTLAPDNIPVKLHCAENPITTNWHGAQQVVQAYGPQFLQTNSITKAEWEEAGKSASIRKFTSL